MPHTRDDVAERRRDLADGGFFGALLEVLDPDVVLRADRGAVSIGASRVARGAANVARQAVVFSRLDIQVRPALVNGAAGTITLRHGGHSRSRASRSETEGSSRWTSSPTPSASASST